MTYKGDIEKIAASIKAKGSEKVASKKEPTRRISAIEKAAQEIIESLEKAAAEEDEDDVVEAAKDIDQEDFDDAVEDAEDNPNVSEEDIAEANEVFVKALHLEKEAEEAFKESQIMKVAALKVLCDCGQCTEEEASVLAECTLDDIETNE